MTKAEFIKKFEGSTKFSVEALELLYVIQCEDFADEEDFDVQDYETAYNEDVYADLQITHDISIQYEDETGWNTALDAMVYNYMDKNFDIVGETCGGTKILYLA